MALFAGNLLSASFRGAPFAVVADETGGGRRIALHQYPGRDTPWAEDMGRAPRTFRFRGFIVDGDVVFAGGPIQLQRAQLLAALEASGAGLLTHPTLGALNVCVTRFSLGQDLGASSMSTFDVEFVESGARSFPSLLTGGSGLLSAANLCAAALAIDGVRAITIASAAGGRRQDLTATAATWATQVTTIGGDATALHRLTAQLPGSYGRYAGGGNVGVGGSSATPYNTTTTIADLVAVASQARATIAAASAALGQAIVSADLAYASDLSVAVIALVQALASACADPADAIRLLSMLVSWTPPRAEALTPIGAAFSSMIQRAAIAALIVAVGTYQPASRDDAAAKIAVLGELLFSAMLSASAAEDAESFKAVRAARGAIVQNLRTRGATLATIRTFTTARAAPALALAQRFYRDPARADQLTLQAGPAHPLFMPTRFEALSA